MTTPPSLPDVWVELVVDALPGAVLWDGEQAFDDGDLLVFDAQVPPTPPRRYVVVYPGGGRRGAGEENVEHDSTGAAFGCQVTSVAPTRQEAEWLSATVADALVDARPEAPGWEAGLIEHTLAGEPRPDEQVRERHVIFIVDRYTVHAERVPVPAS